MSDLSPEDKARIEAEERRIEAEERYREQIRQRLRNENQPVPRHPPTSQGGQTKTAPSWGWPQKVGILLLTIVVLAVIQRVCEYNRDDEVKHALCGQEAEKAAVQQGYRIAGGTSGTVRPYFSKEYGQCYVRTE